MKQEANEKTTGLPENAFRPLRPGETYEQAIIFAFGVRE